MCLHLFKIMPVTGFNARFSTLNIHTCHEYKGFKVASHSSGKGNVTLKCMCKYSSPKEHLRLDRTYTPNHGISCGFCDILVQAFERHSGPPASWLPALSALFRHPAPPVFSPDCWVGFEGRFHGQEIFRGYLVVVYSEDQRTAIRCNTIK